MDMETKQKEEKDWFTIDRIDPDCSGLSFDPHSRITSERAAAGELEKCVIKMILAPPFFAGRSTSSMSRVLPE